MNKTYLFISDIHLGLQSKEIEDNKEKLLVKFLEFAKSNCDELFIAGDLFDYWFEYKRVYQKGNYRTLTALRNLTDAGIKIHYFIGNHDFFHKDFFEKEIGVILISRWKRISIKWQEVLCRARRWPCKERSWLQYFEKDFT